jgi:hypothetical protein
MNKQTLNRIELSKQVRKIKNEYMAFKSTSKKNLEVDLKNIDKLIKDARNDYGIKYRSIHSELKLKTDNIKGIEKEIEELKKTLSELREELKETIEQFEDIKKEKQRVHDDALKNVEAKYTKNTSSHFNNLSSSFVKQYQEELNSSKLRKKNNADLAQKTELLTRISKSKFRSKPTVRGTRSIRPALSTIVSPKSSSGSALNRSAALSRSDTLNRSAALSRSDTLNRSAALTHSLTSKRTIRPRTRKIYNPLSRNL